MGNRRVRDRPPARAKEPPAAESGSTVRRRRAPNVWSASCRPERQLRSHPAERRGRGEVNRSAARLIQMMERLSDDSKVSGQAAPRRRSGRRHARDHPCRLASGRPDAQPRWRRQGHRPDIRPPRRRHRYGYRPLQQHGDESGARQRHQRCRCRLERWWQPPPGQRAVLGDRSYRAQPRLRRLERLLPDRPGGRLAGVRLLPGWRRELDELDRARLPAGHLDGRHGFAIVRHPYRCR